MCTYVCVCTIHSIFVCIDTVHTRYLKYNIVLFVHVFYLFQFHDVHVHFHGNGKWEVSDINKE